MSRDQTSASLVARALAQGDLGGVLLAAALVGQGDLVAGLVLPDLADEGGAAVDDRVVELGDGVAGLETRLVAGPFGVTESEPLLPVRAMVAPLPVSRMPTWTPIWG